MSQDPITFQSIAQVILGLGLVVALIIGLAWLFRRVSALNLPHQKMKVVASLALGTREKAVLVEVGAKQVLLGVAPGRVTHLVTFDEHVVGDTSSNEFAKVMKEVSSTEGQK